LIVFVVAPGSSALPHCGHCPHAGMKLGYGLPLGEDFDSLTRTKVREPPMAS